MNLIYLFLTFDCDSETWNVRKNKQCCLEVESITACTYDKFFSISIITFRMRAFIDHDFVYYRGNHKFALYNTIWTKLVCHRHVSVCDSFCRATCGSEFLIIFPYRNKSFNRLGNTFSIIKDMPVCFISKFLLENNLTSINVNCQ